MGTYFNPSNMFGELDYKPSGAYGGYLAGIQQQYALANADRMNRDDDLGYLQQNNKYQNDLKDNPVLDSARAVNLASNKDDLSLYESGKMKQGKEAKIDQEVANSQLANMKVQAAQKDKEGQFLLEFSDAIKRENPSLLNQNWWKNWQEKGQKAGIKMPPVFNPASIQAVHSGAQSYVMNAPTIRSILERQESAKGTLGAAQVSADSRLKAAEIAARARVSAAGISGSYAAQRQDDKPPTTKNAVVARIINKPNPSPREMDVAASLEFQERLDKNPTLASGLRKATKAGKEEEFVAAEQAKIKDELFGDSTPAPAKTQQTSIPKVSSDADFEKLPKGAIFVGPDGVKRRKS